MTSAAARVEQLRRLGRLADAEREARTALAEHPQDAELLGSLAAVLLAGKRHVEGLAVAEAASAADPGYERGHRLRALHLSRLGRHQEAVQAGYVSVSLLPEEAVAALGYAQVLQRAGRTVDALQVARRAVALEPESAVAHHVLGDINFDLGARRDARAAYREALRIEPQNADVLHDLARLDALQQHPGRALRGFVDAGVLDPGMGMVMPAITTVLWRLSWQLRMGLAGAVLIAFVASGPDPDTAAWSVRIAATTVLGAAALLTWWTARGLPRQTGQVLRAALRADVPLTGTYLAIAVCLLLYAAVAVTGVAVLAAAVWVVLVLLGWFTLGVRLLRRRPR
ncbi:tetratricopeptide repeat protein [Pseudonocardia sp. GCM10023141]|uniref:tetratricopeptide repeat protein n=1 Tax=Pseudonocardia sp. GCM10023141 TaxID=3252653 RepID=UPI003609ED43